MSQIIVIKKNIQEEETWRYSGRLLKTKSNAVLIEAYFNRPDLSFHGITLKENDRFIEVYFTNRWYNIFEIHDVDDDRLKAWYCNVTFPAEIRLENSIISYIDLALDLLVFPDGRQLVLDEDEFADLPLTEDIRQKGRAALAELKILFDVPEAFHIAALLD